RGEGGDHASDPPRADTDRLLGLHHVPARAALSQLVSQPAPRPPAPRPLSGAGAEVPTGAGGPAGASRGAFRRSTFGGLEMTQTDRTCKRSIRLWGYNG